MGKAKGKAAAVAGGKTVRVVTETVEERAEEPGGELELDELPGDDDAEDADALAELEALAGSGARYEIRRTAPAPFTGYVGTYSRDIFTPDLLQQEWGGGNFTLRVKNSKGEYVGSRQIQLAGEPHHKKEATPAAPVAANNPGGEGQLAAVLNAINASNEAARKAGEGQIALLTTLVTSLINREPPKSPDPLAMIGALKDVLKPDKGTDTAEVMKMFREGLALGKDLAGDSGDTSMLDVANKGLDMIGSLASQQAAHAPAAQRRALPRPVAPAGTVPAIEAPAPVVAQPTTPNNAPPPAQEKPVTGLMQKLNWIRQQTAMLCRLAHAGKDPELYAEVFLDNLPPYITEQEIRGQMSAPDAIAKLSQLNGNVAKYAAWFEEFRAAVVELIEAEDAEPGESELQTGGDDAAFADPEGGEIIEPMPDSEGGEGNG